MKSAKTRFVLALVASGCLITNPWPPGSDAHTRQRVGGRTYFTNSSADIARIANEVMRDIRTQYVLGYVPSGNASAKDFHKVLVSVGEIPTRKNVSLSRA